MSISLVEKALIIKNTPLFESLDLDLLLALSEKIKISTYQAQRIIFQIGQEAQRLYIIASGQVELKDEKKQRIASLSSYETFGDESLFNGEPRTYTAVTTASTTLLSLSLSDILTIISENPTVAIEFLKSYATQVTCRHKHKLTESP